ncbi:hypothetical protein N9N67_00235 [Bacteriovoracaceae bacterium]|nr:hypothetical protein [Bacteriovoracaceae bacterium]
MKVQIKIFLVLGATIFNAQFTHGKGPAQKLLKDESIVIACPYANEFAQGDSISLINKTKYLKNNSQSTPLDEVPITQDGQIFQSSINYKQVDHIESDVTTVTTMSQGNCVYSYNSEFQGNLYTQLPSGMTCLAGIYDTEDAQDVVGFRCF